MTTIVKMMMEPGEGGGGHIEKLIREMMVMVTMNTPGEGVSLLKSPTERAREEAASNPTTFTFSSNLLFFFSKLAIIKHSVWHL